MPHKGSHIHLQVCSGSAFQRESEFKLVTRSLDPWNEKPTWKCEYMKQLQTSLHIFSSRRLNIVVKPQILVQHNRQRSLYPGLHVCPIHTVETDLSVRGRGTGGEGSEKEREASSPVEKKNAVGGRVVCQDVVQVSCRQKSYKDLSVEKMGQAKWMKQFWWNQSSEKRFYRSKRDKKKSDGRRRRARKRKKDKSEPNCEQVRSAGWRGRRSGNNMRHRIIACNTHSLASNSANDPLVETCEKREKRGPIFFLSRSLISSPL